MRIVKYYALMLLIYLSISPLMLIAFFAWWGAGEAERASFREAIRDMNRSIWEYTA